jgi:PIN domain nuclease of toxin-antitoxin system
VRVLLDTGVFVTVALRGLDALKSRKARRTLEDPKSQLDMSALSLTEIAIKHSIQKLNLPAELALEAARDMRLNLIPYTMQHAYGFSCLPRLHLDPFDRMIIATALVEGIPVVSADENFQQYKNIKVLW